MRAVLTFPLPTEGCANCPLKLQKLTIDRCMITKSNIDDEVFRKKRAGNCPLRLKPDEEDLITYPVVPEGDRALEVLRLPTREYHCLKRDGINTVNQLREVAGCDSYLLKIRGVGVAGLQNIRRALEVYDEKECADR